MTPGIRERAPPTSWRGGQAGRSASRTLPTPCILREVPIPTLDAHGILPAGVHAATLDEIETAFGLSNARRAALVGKLRQYVGFVQSFALFTDLYVDGSFVTDAPLPNDIDVVLELHPANLVQLLGHPQSMAILNARGIKTQYEVHQFIEPPPCPMAAFFQQMRPADAIARSLSAAQKRGILKVTL
jgi:hypothetical protein